MQEEVSLLMSSPPLFIGSEDGFAEMSPDVLPSQEEVEGGNLGAVGKELELDLPELPRVEAVVGAAKTLTEIPDSDAESEVSSPVKRGLVDREERNGEAEVVEQEEDLIENGSVLGQEESEIEEQNGGGDWEQMDDVEKNAVSFVGLDGGVEIEKSDDPFTHQTVEDAPSTSFLLDINQNDENNMHTEDDHIIQPATTCELQDVVADDRMAFDTLTTMEDQLESFKEPNHLHTATSHLEQDHGQSIPTIAHQKSQLNALGALQDAQDAEDLPSDGSPASMNFDMESARPHEITDTQTIENNPSLPHAEVEVNQKGSDGEYVLSHNKHVEDLGRSGEGKLSEGEVANLSNEEPTEENLKKESCTSTLEKEIPRLLSTETEDAQAMECLSMEDEVSLIPTEDSSQVKATTTEDSFTHGETEYAIMEDVLTQESVIVDPPAVEDPVPRATRRKSARKSDTASAVAPKQSRRVSARGTSQLDSKITEPQLRADSSTMDLENNLEVPDTKPSTRVAAEFTTDMKSEKKPARKASSTRKKSQPKTKAEEVPPPDPITATIRDVAEPSRGEILAPDLAPESQYSKELPKKSPVTRRKSQHETKRNEIIPIQADSPARLEEDNEMDEKDTIMTPASKPPKEAPTRKKSQIKASATLRKASGKSTKRQREDEPKEQPEVVVDTIPVSPPVPEVLIPISPEPQKPVVSQRPLLQAREGSQSKDVLIAELKAMKIVSRPSLCARISILTIV